jgi:hypothetical protein
MSASEELIEWAIMSGKEAMTSRLVTEALVTPTPRTISALKFATACWKFAIERLPAFRLRTRTDGISPAPIFRRWIRLEGTLLKISSTRSLPFSGMYRLVNALASM